MANNTARRTTKRLLWLDLVKGICMFFIVMSHAYPTDVFSRFYSPFFLCAFFLASGYTFSKRGSFIDFTRHKMRTILLPYWSFGLINALLAHFADGDQLSIRLLGLLLSRNRHDDDLWFVMCLFTMQLLFYAICTICEKRQRHRKYGTEALLFLLSCACMVAGYAYMRFVGTALVFQLETALVMLPYMALGYLMKQFHFSEIRRAPLLLVFITIAYFVSIMSTVNIVNIHGERYGIVPIFVVSAFLGCIMIVLLCICLERRFDGKCLLLISFVGQNTFVYYAFQSKAIRALDVVYDRTGLALPNSIRCLIYAALACAILAIPAMIINRWFPFLLGRGGQSKER